MDRGLERAKVEVGRLVKRLLRLSRRQMMMSLIRVVPETERSGQVQVTQEVKTNKASDRKIALPQIKRNREENIRVLKKNYFAP